MLFAAIALLWSVGASAQVFTLTLQPNTIPSGTNGAAYSQLITAVGGNAPYTFAVTSGTLPTGLILDSNGLLHGTPTTPSSGSFTITATDVDGNTGFRPYTFSIGTSGGITINPASLPSGTQGVAYSQTLTTTGSSGGNVFSVSAGSLPPGLSLSSGGAITGTPSTGGTFNFTAFVRDSNGNTGSRAYSLNIVVPITVNPSSLPSGTTGTPYNQTVTATGGTSPYTFAVTAGSLPTGLSLASGGGLTGTPSAAGSYSFTIQATDAGANTGSRAYNVTINAAPLAISPSSLPAGTQGVAYSQTVTASGGVGPYSYLVLSGSLPTGLSLNPSTGAITGTPSAGGSFSFTIQATDSSANTGTRAYTVNIGTNSLTVNPSSLPNGTQGAAYNQTVSASGGTGPYTFALTSGALPAGLSMSSGGVISGTASGSGASSFTVQATDSVGNVGSRAYSVNIGTNSLTVNPASLPAGTRTVAYSQTVSAAGGTGPYTFAISAGSLPAGLSLNASSGLISGTPTGLGSSSFTIRATDTLGNVGTRAYAVNIGTVTLTVNPATLTPPILGRPYSQTVTATGGTGPYTFSIAAGALPPGMTLNATTGIISGTTTASGVSSFTIQARDINGNIGSRAYSLTNRPDPAADAEVIGLINAQAAAARRFASAQLDNLSRHLETLHNFNPCSVQFGVSLPPPPTDIKDRPYPGTSPYSPSPGVAARSYDASPNSPAGQVARRMPGGPDCENGGWASSIAAWVSGSVQFGSVMPDGSVASGHFTTAGLTAGIDWRVHADLVVGAAVGYGSDRSTIGSFGTRSDSTSLSGAIYASYSAFDPWFIDAAIGYGQLSYDSRRYVANDGIAVTGSRTGGYWFGTASTGYEMKYQGLRVSPYARLDFMRAQLDSYAEQGTSAELLTYGVMNFHSVSGSVGLRGSYDMPMRWGVLTPMARAEFRQTLDGSFQQSMYYTDLGASMASTLTQASASRGTINTSLGLRARSLGGVSGEVEYGTSSGSGKVQSQTIRAALKMAF